jgi:antitoxin component of RelBE/YafQ-DinJ toxin-antitoxin module
MSTTKTVSTRIDDNVHTLFTQYCNLKGLTMSQMLNQFVNDIVTQNKDFINSLQCSKNDESTKPQNFSQDEPLEEELKLRKKLDEKIRVLDSKNRKENEPEFNQSKDELGEFMKSLKNDSRKNNHNYNQDLVKLAFAPYLKDLKQSITDLNTKFETKLEEDKMKKGMKCTQKDSCFNI